MVPHSLTTCPQLSQGHATRAFLACLAGAWDGVPVPALVRVNLAVPHGIDLDIEDAVIAILNRSTKQLIAPRGQAHFNQHLANLHTP